MKFEFDTWKKYTQRANANFAKKQYIVATMLYESAKNEALRLLETNMFNKDASTIVLTSFENTAELYKCVGDIDSSRAELQSLYQLFVSRLKHKKQMNSDYQVYVQMLCRAYHRLLRFDKEFSVSKTQFTSPQTTRFASPQENSNKSLCH